MKLAKKYVSYFHTNRTRSNSILGILGCQQSRLSEKIGCRGTSAMALDLG
mgnify:CR=1 FL=1